MTPINHARAGWFCLGRCVTHITHLVSSHHHLLLPWHQCPPTILCLIILPKPKKTQDLELLSPSSKLGPMPRWSTAAHSRFSAQWRLPTILSLGCRPQAFQGTSRVMNFNILSGCNSHTYFYKPLKMPLKIRTGNSVKQLKLRSRSSPYPKNTVKPSLTMKQRAGQGTGPRIINECVP